jgi:Lrp/AsnC family transcriptional regulator for asnA, asnC and gidA
MNISDYQIDKLDREIMAFLLENARMPYTEIAQKLIVSPGTIHVRMKKLEKMGVVLGTELVVDPAKLGYDLTVFVGIFLKESMNYDEVVQRLRKIDEVVEAYYTTGGYGIFLKLICKNTNHLRSVLSEKIQSISGIQRTETMISLEQSIRKKMPLQEVSLNS